eukprot:c7727_g1_i1.p1 GENE.c7727_g1_i1~~c7727_g1_i1.p1  ORF type:complete len:213 (-),score=29.92 c7727_g1_i1:479-1117(-)
MEANKEEAERCIRLAQERLDQSDYVAAIKFLEKSIRMFHTTQADEMLQAARARLPNAQSSSHSQQQSSTSASPPPTTPTNTGIVWWKPWTLIHPSYHHTLLVILSLIILLSLLKWTSSPPQRQHSTTSDGSRESYSYARSHKREPTPPPVSGWSFTGGFFPFGFVGGFGLPGDIMYSNSNFVFAAPMMSSILLSILLSFVMNAIAPGVRRVG